MSSNVGTFRSLKRISDSLQSLLIAGVLSASLVCASADQVTTAGPNGGFGPFQVGIGGEFTMIPDAQVAGLLSGYSPFARDYAAQGSFQTFCLEVNEVMLPNFTYDVTRNNVTVFTGTPLSVGAAYLYQQFATGNLLYDYTDVPAGSRTTSPHSAYFLQHAIWYSMGQYGYEAGNYYDNLVNGLFGAGVFAPDNGAHGVEVLNLWAPGQPHDPAHSYQDVLILTRAVPEPSTMFLSGLGMAALLIFRRRK